MEINAKFKREVEEFETAFKKFKDKKIVFYGTGRKAVTLLQGVKEFQIIGLCDKDDIQIGKMMYGYPVISREQAERDGDLIIICTSPSYWSVIYERIKDWKIPVYYLNGELAEGRDDKEILGDVYWEKSISQLENLIKEYEVISFDVFDTLLMRKCCLPTDVFRFTEARLCREFGIEIPFAELRNQAKAGAEELTQDEIYENLASLSGWSEEILNRARELELEVNKILLVPRREIKDLCMRIIGEKEVWIVTDMYYPAETIAEFLKHCGIEVPQERILVSCELKKSKSTGELWKYYKENVVCGRKALHIGDNQRSDIENAGIYGIEGYQIRSAMELLEHSSVGKILPYVVTNTESLMLGSIIADKLNNPFALCESKGKITFSGEEDAGKMLVGPLVYSFSAWLAEEAEADGIDAICFFARDGYLLQKAYKKYKEMTGRNDLPQSQYVEISRRAVMGACVENEEDFKALLAFPYDGNLEDFMEERLGCRVSDATLHNIQYTDLNGDIDRLTAILEPYKGDIQKELNEERTNYLRYLESLAVPEKHGIVDLWIYGTTQYYFDRIANGEKSMGYYFFAQKKNNPLAEKNIMKGCFMQDDMEVWNTTKLTRRSFFWESFFTSPKGSLIQIRQDGTKIYAEEMSNQKYFSVREHMMDGVYAFMEEYIRLLNQLGIELENERFFSEEYVYVLMDNGFEVPDFMRNSFYYDNVLMNHRESGIWQV